MAEHSDAVRGRGTGGVASLGAMVSLVLVACAGDPASPGPDPLPQPAGVYDVGASTLVNLTALNVVGDARPDLIAVARSDLSIRILPGDHVSGFGQVIALPAESDARQAAAGDVNGDGIPDLLVIGHDNALNVRLGLGGAEFGVPVRYPLRNHGSRVVVADLNGDRFDDVVAVHDGSGAPVYVTAYLGSATGDLQRVWEVGTPYFTTVDVAAGDFDGDARTDVAVALSDPQAAVLVFHGLGTGDFGAPTILPPVTSNPGTDGTIALAVGDLNADGRDDLVIACYGFTNQLVVRLGTASGFSDAVVILLPSPVDVALGDVNGDGRLDAVAANLEHATLSLLYGRGDGSFEAPVSVPSGPAPASLGVRDFDGDGMADVAEVDLGDHSIRVFPAPGVHKARVVR